MKRLVSLMLIAAALLALCAPLALADTWWVYTEDGKRLNVRSDPSVGSGRLGKLDYGSKVNVRMTLSSGWAVIDYKGGVGYVQSRYLRDYQPSPYAELQAEIKAAEKSKKTSSSSASTPTLNDINSEFRTAKQVVAYTVVARPSRASGWVNLRWAPNTKATLIATCPQGKELTVLCELRNWYQVQDPETGMIGFISRKYVTRK